jgi:hypothetical protein
VLKQTLVTTNLTYHDKGHTLEVGVTGRDIERAIESALSSHSSARDFVRALRSCGLAIVPIAPTHEMIEGAWAEALAEDARGVWSSMVEVSQRALENQ